VEGAFSTVKPATPEGIPLYFGGASPAAIEAGTRHADVYMLWGEPRDQVAERIAALREAAAAHGRTLRFSLSIRPIIADTEEAAWDRAERIRALTAARAGKPGDVRAFRMSTSVGSARLQEQAAENERHDERLWYGITALTGPGGNSTALVGTPEQVAEALDGYRQVGVDTILIRGFDPLEDVVDWGRRLVPLLRTSDAALV
jgi:alkanesulfonate monooxygenase